MMGLPLGFASPLVLIGLLSLPVLWWLLRLIPPRPRRIHFPPTRLLFDIAPKEETPARTPWWLTLLRLTLAALVIIAAAGPLWNPPVATSSGAASLALLIDDGWSAAASWEARLRTADDIIARAEADNRGVALVPLSEPVRDISLEPPAAARVRLRQLKPKPHTVERTDAIANIARFLAATPDVAVVWLSDGVDAGRGADFIDALARTLERRPITVVEGGIRAGAGAGRGGQRSRRTHRQGAARSARSRRGRHHPRPRSQGPSARRDALWLQGRRPRDRGRVHFAGRNPQRYRASGDRLRAFGRGRAIAGQALAPAHHRRGIRRNRGHRAAAARLHLLSVARPQPLRRRATCRRRRAGRSRQALYRSERAHAHSRRRRQCRGRGARAPDALDRGRRGAGALCRATACRRQRRYRPGQAAPRRAYPRRQPELGTAAEARGICTREPVRRDAGSRRRDGQSSGAGGTGFRPDRAHLGDARRRHAARHRPTAEQGRHRAVSRHRRHALVRLAALRILRRNAQAHRFDRRLDHRDGSRRSERACRARRGSANPRARRLRSLRPAAGGRTAGARRLCRPRERRSSAGLLWTARGAGRGQHACACRTPGRA